MNQQELNSEILQKLTEFDSLGNIELSEEWNNSLLKKIDYSQKHSLLRLNATKFTFILVLIMLINIGFFINTMLSHKQKISHRSNDLQVISKELLINPVSLNN